MTVVDGEREYTDRSYMVEVSEVPDRLAQLEVLIRSRFLDNDAKIRFKRAKAEAEAGEVVLG